MTKLRVSMLAAAALSSCVAQSALAAVHPVLSLTDASLPLGVGFAVAAADLDGDGTDELIVGYPGSTTADVERAGLLIVYNGRDYDKDTGFTYVWPRWFGESDFGGVNNKGALFGFSLAVGDFDHDGRKDVAVGAPGDTVNGQAEAGSVYVLYGDGNGLFNGKKQILSQATPGVPGAAEKGDHFGFSLQAGHFDQDRDDPSSWLKGEDLAIGVPHEDLAYDGADVANAGVVNVLFGREYTGLHAADGVIIEPKNVGARPEANDLFGYALGIEPYSFYTESVSRLMIGAPGEDIEKASGTVVDAGAAYWVDSDPGHWKVTWSWGSMINPDAQARSYHGYSLGAYIGRNCLFTKLVGAPGANENRGQVAVFYGSKYSHSFGEGVLAGSAVPENDDAFGAKLFTSLYQDEVLIAAVSEDLGSSYKDQGFVERYASHEAGFEDGYNCSIVHTYAKFSGSSTNADLDKAYYGWSLATGYWNGARRLVVGAPGAGRTFVETLGW